MADMAGLALSIITLVDTCLTITKLFSTARSFSTEAETLRLGLIREEGRLKTWARSWGIPNDGSVKAEAVPEGDAARLLLEEAENASLDLSAVQRTLDNMFELLSAGGAMQNRHGGQSPGTDSSSVRRTFKARMTSISSRIQWVVNDRDKLRVLISDLKDHNDGLDRLRPRKESPSLSSREAAVTCEVVVSADNLALTLPDEAYEQFPQLREIMAGRRRQIQTEADTPNWAQFTNLKIAQWEYRVAFADQAPIGPRPLAHFRREKGQTEFKVMVEWKQYVSNDSQSKALALSRVERVSQLLRAGSKSPRLCVLDCIGYFENPQKSRCGILFELPFGFWTNAPNKGELPQVVTLSEAISSNARPTLADRFHLAKTLATSMLEFHLRNWLHKDFNAHNVIFFLPRDSAVKNVDIRSPYVGSVGLARPDHLFIESELVSSSRNILDFAYHHPEYRYPTATQSGDNLVVPRYHRIFDVYSLGCVLLEIGLWMPLTSLEWRDRYQRDLASWRRKLQECARKNLSYYAGPIYTEVVLRCLESEIDSEKSMKDSEWVREFCWEIMRKLESLVV